MDLTAAVAQDGANPLLLFGTALVLGALHGLEPGHSKTMMAAFIIAVRGTVGQAVVLGLAAAVSHSLIVWALALLALRYGEALVGEAMEPWFVLASGAVIVGIAGWMLARTWWSRRPVARHAHGHGGHSHGGHGHGGHSHGGHSHGGHGRAVAAEDAHARAHAREIERRFAAGRATLGQTLSFGITGGLIPCSAAITVLILCLNLGQFWLGVGLVTAFSVGLAATLVAAGLAAALGVRYLSRRSAAFDRVFDRAPYVSAAVIGLVGVAMVASSWSHLPAA